MLQNQEVIQLKAFNYRVMKLAYEVLQSFGLMLCCIYTITVE